MQILTTYFPNTSKNISLSSRNSIFAINLISNGSCHLSDRRRGNPQKKNPKRNEREKAIRHVQTQYIKTYSIAIPYIERYIRNSLETNGEENGMRLVRRMEIVMEKNRRRRNRNEDK